MAQEDIFQGTKLAGAMEELSKTKEGRDIASKLQDKLKELNAQFVGFSDAEKKTFLEEFRKKFSMSLKSALPDPEEDVDGVFKLSGEEEIAKIPFSMFNYVPFLLAFAVICLLFG